MFQQKKPYSAVTVTIEDLTSERYEEDDLSGIPDLVEVIKLQATGPTEAARAIRKKLKYGSVHRQIRALTLLDGLIQNAGSRFQRTFADEPLLERLRVSGSSNLSDPEVKRKCRELFRSWSQYSGTQGLQTIAQLHKELPKRKIAVTQERSKVIQETENPFDDEEEEENKKLQQQQDALAAAGGPSQPPRPATQPLGHAKSSSISGTGSFFGSSSKDKKKDKGKTKRKPFNLEAEKEQMKSSIADASIASTNLTNMLQSINRETERISDNPQAQARFEECKTLRRRVLRYIHNVDQEQWLGSLLNANDMLVHSLMIFEQLDRSIDADSDSDDEIAEQAHLYRMATLKGKEGSETTTPSQSSASLDLSGLSIAPARPPPMAKPASPAPPSQPPRPAPLRQVTQTNSDVEDEDDPFGDMNVVETPAFERAEPKW